MTMLEFISFICLCASCTAQIIREESELRLTSHAPRSFITHGEMLEYDFKLTLQTRGDVDEMKILVNGSHLQDLDSSQELPPIPVNPGLSSTFTGSASMAVLYSTPLGSLIRANMYVTFLSNGVVTDEAKIIGEYVFMAVPDIHVSEGMPRYLDVKETSKIDVNITLPTGPMENTLLKVYMPHNDTTSKDVDEVYAEEPFLSVTKLEFLSNAGLEKESVAIIGKISPYYMSNTRTSETDQVSVAIPEVKVQPGQKAEIRFVTEAEVLDYAGADDGQEMLIGYVLEVGDGIFVVRKTSLISEEKSDIERHPNLTVLSEVDEFVENGTQYNVLLEIGLEHAKDSWGSAYNISLKLYLPAYFVNVSVGRTVDMLRMNRWVYNNRNVLNSSVYEFELKRLSFVHQTRVYLNMTLDAEHVEFAKDHMTIYVDAVYNGWRGDEEFVTSDGFTFKIDVDKVDEPQFACKCTDNVKFDCVCGDTRKNGCDVKGSRCVDCNTPWKCVKTLPGYGKRSRLNDKQGNKYRCGKAERNKRVVDLKPCIVIDGAGQITEMDAAVGALLGKNGTSDDLYGISQNGLAYMAKYLSNIAVEMDVAIGALLGKNGTGDDLYGISRNGLAYIASYDAGNTWYSIPPELYNIAAANRRFIRATFY